MPLGSCQSIYGKEAQRIKEVPIWEKSKPTQEEAAACSWIGKNKLRRCSIVAHCHDKLIIEADHRVSLEAICKQMGRVPPWVEGLVLRADGYVCDFYKKD